MQSRLLTVCSPSGWAKMSSNTLFSGRAGRCCHRPFLAAAQTSSSESALPSEGMLGPCSGSEGGAALSGCSMQASFRLRVTGMAPRSLACQL